MTRAYFSDSDIDTKKTFAERLMDFDRVYLYKVFNDDLGLFTLPLILDLNQKLSLQY